MQKISKYHPLLFPLSLVLFEFAVYLANDMIQPAMLKIVADFNTGIEWVPSSLTAFLVGGVVLQWLLGPLSDKHGRRPIMLTGVLFFVISCLAILLVKNIEQFIIIRCLQGIGLCLIGTVGYATIQEVYDEKLCIKIIALVSNIALIAPLLGPLIGAALIDILPWQSMFIIFATIGFISFIGLLFFMPETVTMNNSNTLSLYALWYDYKQVVKNIRFICGTLAIGFAGIPLLSWIALSPVILISEAGLSISTYALLQIPVFCGLISGNITLSYLIGKKITLPKLIVLGGKPMIIGLIVAGISTFHLSQSYLWMILGLSIYLFGLGITNACLTRLTLFSSNISKGTVSSAMGIISMVLSILGIELSKIVYLVGHQKAFNMLNLFIGLCWFILVAIFTHKSTKHL